MAVTTQDRDSLPADQQEDAGDLGQPGRRFDAVITATDWTVATIIQQLRRHNIELNPDFQRRQAWRQKRKSEFIESLILGVPVPQIVLAERKEKRGTFIVIDGKQRLLTLRQFCAAADDPLYASFKLSGLDIRKDLNDTDFDGLNSIDAFASDLSAFENSTIRTAVLRNWPDEYFLYTVFLRLNTGSVPLSPQELRQALHPGPFLKFIDDFAANSSLMHRALRITEPDFRMRDTELVLRYFAFSNFLQDYTGNLKPLLDHTAEFFNSVAKVAMTIIDEQTNELEFALCCTMNIFGDENAFRKWNGERFERPLNRAVFDVMVLYFSHRQCAEACMDRSAEVILLFQNLCVSDQKFRSSIEGTTKTIDAIFTRLHKWGLALQSLVGDIVDIPELRGNRIILRPNR